MKSRIIISVIVFSCITQTILAQNYSLGYDATGNRQNRIILLKSASIISDFESGETAPDEYKYNETIDGLIISFFPNPTRNEINVKIENLNSDLPTNLTLYDNVGRMIRSLTQLQAYNTVNLLGLPTGTYFITLKIGDSVSEWKIIKE